MLRSELTEGGEKNGVAKLASRRKGCYSLLQHLDVAVDHTGFHRLRQVAAYGFEDVGCDDFLHSFVGLGFGEVVLRVRDGDELGVARGVFEYELQGFFHDVCLLCFMFFCLVCVVPLVADAAPFRLTAFGTFPEGQARWQCCANFLGSPLGELSQ